MVWDGGKTWAVVLSFPVPLAGVGSLSFQLQPAYTFEHIHKLNSKLSFPCVLEVHKQIVPGDDLIS